MNRRGRLEWWQDPPTDAELAADEFNPADFDPDFDYKPEEDDVPCGAQYGSNPDTCHQPTGHVGTHSNRWGCTWAGGDQ